MATKKSSTTAPAATPALESPKLAVSKSLAKTAPKTEASPRAKAEPRINVAKALDTPQAASPATKEVAKTKRIKPTAPTASAAPVEAERADKATSPEAGKVKKSATPKASVEKTAQILDSTVAYEGPLFRVLRDHLIEPDGRESFRDVIRHNGSVVILAVDPGKSKKDPWVVIERQYRHAAGQYLWELPAGKLDAGEKPIDGAKRELGEETGYKAKKWTPLVNYFASPGFLGEAMKIFLAEGLIAGDAHPEEDEHIDFRLVKLSDLLGMIEKGKILDGKTLISVLLYARQLGVKLKK